MSETNKIPTTEKDFLEQDQVIRGQNYVCLSFISPDEVIEKKEQYFFGKFMENYCKQNTELLGEYEQIFPEKKDIIRHIREKYNQLFDHSSIKEAYDNFVKSNADELQTEYNDTHSFQTNIGTGHRPAPLPGRMWLPIPSGVYRALGDDHGGRDHGS